MQKCKKLKSTKVKITPAPAISTKKQNTVKMQKDKKYFLKM